LLKNCQFSLVQSKQTRRTFFSKAVAGVSLAGIFGTFFTSRVSAASGTADAVKALVKPDRRAVSRGSSGKKVSE
jgi:hypothetical protein